MISSKNFLDALLEREIKFFSGVPCSYLTPLINDILSQNTVNYIPASSEGDALAMASGAWLSGRIGVVMCQNSGLGNMINPLTSLNAPFKIPALLLITWRGHPDEKDEPQHKVMGMITPRLLDLMNIHWCLFPENQGEIEAVLEGALKSIQKYQTPYAILLRKDSFCVEQKEDIPKSDYPSREEALKIFLQTISKNDLVIATTGKTGRELYTLHDGKNQLYCVGSMGYANALAHGIALTTAKRVFVIDGDGAAIMHLGNLVTIGAAASNLIHILLDNQVYDSTGAQPTASQYINFPLIAQGAGYKTIHCCSSLHELSIALQAKQSAGPTFIYMRIQAGSMEKLGRQSVPPDLVARRLRDFIENNKE